MANVNANVLLIILEDGLAANQTNFFSQVDDPNLGDFGKGGAYGNSSPRIEYKHVARGAIGDSFNGSAGYIPSTVTGGEEIYNELTFDIAGFSLNYEKTSMVCLLIDVNTGKIINAGISKLTNALSVDEIIGNNKVSIDSYGQQITASFSEACDAVVTLYDTNGMLINQLERTVSAGETVNINANGKKGIVLVKVVAGSETIVEKVVVE